MIVLGIDPGVANTGYGIVAHDRGRLFALDGGVVETPAGLDAGARLAEIHRRVGELMDGYKPDAVAVEDLYFGANARSAFAVGQARGVVLLAAAQRDLPVREATPSEVKSAVCGDGRADKAAVARMVALVLGMAELPTPDDAADALAIAIWAANRSRTAGPGTSRVLDRAAIAPLETGETPYERAVREAVRRERASGVRERPGTRGPA